MRTRGARRVAYCSACQCYSCRRIRADRTTRALNRKVAIVRMLNSASAKPNEETSPAGGNA